MLILVLGLKLFIDDMLKKLLKIFPVILWLFTVPVFSQGITPYELNEIKFEGNSMISDGELEQIIFSRESPNWFYQFLDNLGLGESAVYFDSLLVPSDLQALRSFYLDQGFFESEISANYNIIDDSTSAELIFTINEDEPVLLESFDVMGLRELDPNISDRVFTEIISVDSTDRFTRQLVESNLNSVLTFLRDHGYALVSNTTPDILVDTMRNRASVKIFLDHGRRYRFDDVRVQKAGEGKELIEDELIREIVGIERMDFYSSYDIRRAQVRLYRTNLFTSAVVNGVIADTSEDFMPLNISTSVGLLNEIAPEIIVNNEDNAFNLGLGVNYSRKNFIGDARLFQISTSAASESITEFITDFSINDTSLYGYSDARIALEQPYLFGRPINSRIETYVTLQKRRDEYNALLFGAKLSLNFELPRRTYFSGFRISLDWIRSKYVYSDGYLVDGVSVLLRKLGIPEDQVESTAEEFVDNSIDDKFTQNTNTILGFNLSANKSNNVLFPTTGYTLNALLEDGNSIAYLVGKTGIADFDAPLYIKTTLTGSIYFPVFDDENSTLAMKLKVGNIFTYQGNQGDIPINQRLYAGGSNSVRGWRTRTLVPALQFSTFSLDDITDIIRGLSPGGFFLLEGTVETRNRLFGKFGSALFVDFGNVWNSYSDFRYDKVAIAAGMGIRYYSEFAPLRIDFGFKVFDPEDTRSFFNKITLKETFEFHLGIGEAF
ncbi:MAG: outer membrane protein assembly factor [Melioribacteraceae bacterium]|nr:MAG: outer membrane protein assembly factor [Melioribacteraceae bacterium]